MVLTFAGEVVHVYVALFAVAAVGAGGVDTHGVVSALVGARTLVVICTTVGASQSVIG